MDTMRAPPLQLPRMHRRAGMSEVPVRWVPCGTKDSYTLCFTRDPPRSQSHATHRPSTHTRGPDKHRPDTHPTQSPPPLPCKVARALGTRWFAKHPESPGPQELTSAAVRAWCPQPGDLIEVDWAGDGDWATTTLSDAGDCYGLAFCRERMRPVSATAAAAIADSWGVRRSMMTQSYSMPYSTSIIREAHRATRGGTHRYPLFWSNSLSVAPMRQCV